MTPATQGTPSDPLVRPATPHGVRAAATSAGLSQSTIERAVEIATRTPDARQWSAFLSRTLALLGALLLLAGAICAVAYNWARFGKFGKFALVEFAIVIAALLGWWLLPRLSGRIALFAAAVLVGPLLAIYGQTYQTGADPYGLFLTWALLIVPWVVVARFSLLWVLLIGLIDLTMMLWWSQIIGTQVPVVPLAIAMFHGAALIAWEWQLRRPAPWLDEHWAAYAVAAGGLAVLTMGASVFVVNGLAGGFAGVACAALLAAAIAGAFHYYRRVRPDPLMVTLAGVAGMVILAVFVGRVIFDWLDLEVFGFLLMTAFVIAEITYGLKWYRGSRAEPRPGAG